MASKIFNLGYDIEWIYLLSHETMTEASAGVLPSNENGERRFLGKRFSTVQILLAVILTVGLLLALNFSSRIQLDRELQAIHAQVLVEIEDLLDRQRALASELDYVKSDAYVEFWARDEGKMIREGEVLIVPQGVYVDTTEEAADVNLFDLVTTAPEPENWELWWALFFDSPPPRLN